MEDRAISWSLHQPLRSPGWPPTDLPALFPFHARGISVSHSTGRAVGAERRAVRLLRLLCTEGAQRTTDQDFWGHTDLDVHARLFLSQDLAPIRFPLCLVLGFLVCEMGVKGPHFTVAETECEPRQTHTRGKGRGGGDEGPARGRGREAEDGCGEPGAASAPLSVSEPGRRRAGL